MKPYYSYFGYTKTTPQVVHIQYSIVDTLTTRYLVLH